MLIGLKLIANRQNINCGPSFFFIPNEYLQKQKEWEREREVADSYQSKYDH